MATTTPLGMLTSRYGRISATQSLGHDGLSVVVVAPEKSAGINNRLPMNTEQFPEILRGLSHHLLVTNQETRLSSPRPLRFGVDPRLCGGDGPLTGRC